MPRNVRNFWIEVSVDGKASRVECGPQAKDGGFTLTVRMRDKGDIVRACSLQGRADETGELALFIEPNPSLYPRSSLDRPTVVTLQTVR